MSFHEINNSGDVNQPLVVVLGMHRSGTSVVTRALRSVGVSLGDRLMPAIAGVNDKGFWEDLDIVNLNERLLSACGHVWHSVRSLKPGDVERLCEQGYLKEALQLLRKSQPQAKCSASRIHVLRSCCRFGAGFFGWTF